MTQIPMIPNWDGLHPLMIHFPIVLFLLAPVFLLFAAFTRADRRSTFLSAALLVMVLGSVSVHASFETGLAARARLDRTGEAGTIVERHRELADLARSSLAMATLLFSLTLLIRTVLQVNMYELTGVLPLGSVVFYGLGLFWLINAAYNGERLVHEFGVNGITSP
jgi:uncharacterized membrane protein